MNNVTDTSSRELALACADFLWRQNATLRGLGLRRLSIDVGHATVAMTVLPSMINGLGNADGGAIFALTEAVFSLASHTHNRRAVATHCSISFLRPARLGDHLIAAATEIVRTPRSGIYDVSVTMEDELVAEFRAHSRVIGGTLLPVTTARQDLTVPEFGSR